MRIKPAEMLLVNGRFLTMEQPGEIVERNTLAQS